MGQGLIFLLYFATIVLAVFLGLRSFHALVSMRREKREVKNFFDSELAREIRNAILDEVSKAKIPVGGKVKTRKPPPKDPPRWAVDGDL